MPRGPTVDRSDCMLAPSGESFSLLPMTRLATLLFATAAALAAPGHAADTARTWTNPEQATADDPDFKAQGEFARDGEGVQVAALGGGSFYVSRFQGGLPGAGWDGSPPQVSTVKTADLDSTLKGLGKVERKSPTLGAKPPKGADVLVGESVDATLVKGEAKDGFLWAGAQTIKEYGDFEMHLEFRLPYKPSTPLSSQDRGNSGIYLHNRYEVQVLDTFGLVYDREQVGVPIKSDPKQWCGCFYKFKTADVPMCLPPLQWQTYDISFRAARFADDGSKTEDVTITVKHNGVVIHDAVQLPKGTGVGGSRKEVPQGPIIFQGHGNPVAYRNVWIAPK